MDSITDKAMRSKIPRLGCIFKLFLFLTILAHAALLSGTIAAGVRWWHEGYVWVLFLRFPTLSRFIILVPLLCVSVPVQGLVGSGKLLKVHKYLAVYAPLGFWIWIGIIDFVFIRFSVLLIDILAFSVSSTLISVQALVYILLDVFYIIEFPFTIWLLYYVGIRGTVDSVLLANSQSRMRKPNRRVKGRVSMV